MLANTHQYPPIPANTPPEFAPIPLILDVTVHADVRVFDFAWAVCVRVYEDYKMDVHQTGASGRMHTSKQGGAGNLKFPLVLLTGQHRGGD